MDLMDVFVKIGADTTGLDEGIDKTKSMASGLVGAVGASFAAIGTAAVAAGTAIVNGAGKVAEYGDNIDKMSQKMGLSAQAYQEWDAVMQHSGTSMEAMKASMKTLANAVESGNESFKKIGLTQEQLAKMSQEEIFEATIAGLQNVKDTTERTYLAGQLLGKGATELGALLNTSAEDTQAMRDRVHELGGVMSDEAVKAAAAYQDQLQDMTTAFDGLKRGLLAEFMPAITTVMDGLTDIFSGNYDEGLDKISQGIDDFVAKLTDALPQVLTVGVKIIESLAQAILENIPKLLPTLVQLVIDIGAMIVENLPLLLTTAAQIIVELAKGIVESAGELLSAGKELLDFVSEGIMDNLPTMLDDGAAMITNLVNGFLQDLPKMIEAVSEFINKFLDYFLQNYPKILETGVDLLMNLINGFVDNFPQIVVALAKFFVQFTATIAKNLPTILQQGMTILAKLITGLLKAIPELIRALPEIIKAIVDTFDDYDWKQIGINILEGLKNGILGAVSSVIDAVKETASEIWDTLTGFFDINSPSRKFEWAGDMLDEGLAGGVKKNASKVERAIDQLNESTMGALDYNVNSSISQTAPEAVDRSIVVNMNIYGAEGQDVEELAEIVSRKINAVTSRKMKAMGATT